MYIISTDSILAEALEIIIRKAFPASLTVRRTIPPTPDFAVVDIDTVPASPAANIFTISADRKKGADITRPFFEDELCEALFSRLGELPRKDMQEERTSRDLRLTERGFIYKGKLVALTPHEHALLSLLKSNENRCVPTEKIEALFFGEAPRTGNSAEVYIRFLRTKLDFAFGERLIYTVRGKGYMLKTGQETEA